MINIIVKKKLFPHKFLNKSNSQNNFFSADNSYKNIYTGIKKYQIYHIILIIN